MKAEPTKAQVAWLERLEFRGDWPMKGVGRWVEVSDALRMQRVLGTVAGLPGVRSARRR